MANKTERELDIENLEKLVSDGVIKFPERNFKSLEEVADNLPEWRRKRNNDVVYMEYLAKYGRDDDLDKLVHNMDFIVREAVADRGRDKDLDILVNDKNQYVRYHVAMQGRDQDLDKLVYDKYDFVRQAVAEEGRDKDLDILVDDKNWEVRATVARKDHGRNLDKLVYDKDVDVREIVAKYGRGCDLDILINDRSWKVRQQVAWRGRDKDLDILIHDTNGFVRGAAAGTIETKDLENLKQLQKEGKIGQYTYLNDIADKLQKWRKSNKLEDKLCLAIYGRDYDRDKLANDKESLVRNYIAWCNRNKNSNNPIEQ